MHNVQFCMPHIYAGAASSLKGYNSEALLVDNSSYSLQHYLYVFMPLLLLVDFRVFCLVIREKNKENNNNEKDKGRRASFSNS